MTDNFWAWVAQMAPRRLVMDCLLRAVNHSSTLRYVPSGKCTFATDLVISDWREVVNNEERERR